MPPRSNDAQSPRRYEPKTWHRRGICKANRAAIAACTVEMLRSWLSSTKPHRVREPRLRRAFVPVLRILSQFTSRSIKGPAQAPQAGSLQARPPPDDRRSWRDTRGAGAARGWDLPAEDQPVALARCRAQRPNRRKITRRSASMTGRGNPGPGIEAPKPSRVGLLAAADQPDRATGDHGLPGVRLRQSLATGLPDRFRLSKPGELQSPAARQHCRPPQGPARGKPLPGTLSP
jgi:hypothetical protein